MSEDHMYGDMILTELLSQIASSLGQARLLTSYRVRSCQLSNAARVKCCSGRVDKPIILILEVLTV